MVLVIPTPNVFSVNVFCETWNKLQAENFLALVCMTQICFEALTISVLYIWIKKYSLKLFYCSWSDFLFIVLMNRLSCEMMYLGYYLRVLWWWAQHAVLCYLSVWHREK